MVRAVMRAPGVLVSVCRWSTSARPGPVTEVTGRYPRRHLPRRGPLYPSRSPTGFPHRPIAVSLGALASRIRRGCGDEHARAAFVALRAMASLHATGLAVVSNRPDYPVYRDAEGHMFYLHLSAALSPRSGGAASTGSNI